MEAALWIPVLVMFVKNAASIITSVDLISKMIAVLSLAWACLGQLLRYHVS